MGDQAVVFELESPTSCQRAFLPASVEYNTSVSSSTAKYSALIVALLLVAEWDVISYGAGLSVIGDVARPLLYTR